MIITVLIINIKKHSANCFVRGTSQHIPNKYSFTKCQNEHTFSTNNIQASFNNKICIFSSDHINMIIMYLFH